MKTPTMCNSEGDLYPVQDSMWNSVDHPCRRFFSVILDKQNTFQNGKPRILVLIVGTLIVLQLIRVLLVKVMAKLSCGDTVIVDV